VKDEKEQLYELEALIFAADGPLTPQAIRKVLPRLTPARIAERVEEINRDLAGTARPYEIALVSGGYQFRTRPEYGELLLRSQPERRVRLSKAALETLAVIAYRQPVTRAEVEEVRCVDCGAVMKSLLERDLLRIVGRRDAPGRPALYGTTSIFLETFGLPSLRDMPPLRELERTEAAGTTQAEASGESDDSTPGQLEAVSELPCAPDAETEEALDAAPSDEPLQDAG
jgi:segregation and condensation protein B